MLNKFNQMLLRKIRAYSRKIKEAVNGEQELYLFCLYDTLHDVYFSSVAFNSIRHAKTFYVENMKDVDFKYCKLVLQGTFNISNGSIRPNQNLIYIDFDTFQVSEIPVPITMNSPQLRLAVNNDN